MGFPGTISPRPSTLEAVCRDYCTSLARHGFERLFLVPSHGGNFRPLAEMLDGLREAVAPGAHVDAFTVAPTGILGDGRGVSETIGRRCIEGYADLLAAHFRSGTSRAPLEV